MVNYIQNVDIISILDVTEGVVKSFKYLLDVSVPPILFYLITVAYKDHEGVSNHQPYDCLFGRQSKKTSKLCVTGLWAGNSPETGEFSSQMASNAGNASIWWRHHVSISLNTINQRPCIWLCIYLLIYILNPNIIVQIRLLRFCADMFDIALKKSKIECFMKIIGIVDSSLKTVL